MTGWKSETLEKAGGCYVLQVASLTGSLSFSLLFFGVVVSCVLSQTARREVMHYQLGRPFANAVTLSNAYFPLVNCSTT